MPVKVQESRVDLAHYACGPLQLERDRRQPGLRRQLGRVGAGRYKSGPGLGFIGVRAATGWFGPCWSGRVRRAPNGKKGQ